MHGAAAHALSSLLTSRGSPAGDPLPAWAGAGAVIARAGAKRKPPCVENARHDGAGPVLGALEFPGVTVDKVPRGASKNPRVGAAWAWLPDPQGRSRGQGEWRGAANAAQQNRQPPWAFHSLHPWQAREVPGQGCHATAGRRCARLVGCSAGRDVAAADQPRGHTVLTGAKNPPLTHPAPPFSGWV